VQHGINCSKEFFYYKISAIICISFVINRLVRISERIFSAAKLCAVTIEISVEKSSDQIC